MVDRLVVQTQDTIRVLAAQESVDSNNDINHATGLIQDADNSKQVNTSDMCSTGRFPFDTGLWTLAQKWNLTRPIFCAFFPFVLHIFPFSFLFFFCLFILCILGSLHFIPPTLFLSSLRFIFSLLFFFVSFIVCCLFFSHLFLFSVFSFIFLHSFFLSFPFSSF